MSKYSETNMMIEGLHNQQAEIDKLRALLREARVRIRHGDTLYEHGGLRARIDAALEAPNK